MNIIHEFRPPSIYASREEATRAAEKAIERSNNRLNQLIVKIDELEHQIHSWNFGNVVGTSIPKSPISTREKTVIQKNEMTITQKAVFVALLFWALSTTAHLCFGNGSLYDNMYLFPIIGGYIGFLSSQLIVLVVNSCSKRMLLEQERDAARDRLRQIRELVTTGEESVDYRSQSIMNSPLIKQIADIAQ